MLHVLNGDATRRALERSGVPGEQTVWADVLHDGPVPGGLARDALRRVRAAYIAERFAVPDALETLAAWDAALDRHADHEEVVFWFEHDLFDQLILIRHLHWVASLPRPAARFSLICIDRFPGVERFTGLGGLAPEALASLFPWRSAVTLAQVAAGQRAWNLFSARDPRPMLDWLDEGVPDLPWLAGAMRRHFEDYPSADDGLSRTERQILSAIAEGHRTPAAIFHACQAREERVYMGDATFWGILKDLERAVEPLVTLDQTPARMPHGGVGAGLTAAGEQVLAGRADHVALNGIDRWMGGVHLTDGGWRWNGHHVICL